MPRSVTIATCLQWPQVSRSDLEVAQALHDRGVRVEHAPWNAGVQAFVAAEAVLLRSNWDYHHDLERFRDWLGVLEIAGVPIWNSPDLVRWNLDKRYLLDLAEVGVATPTTVVVEDGSPSVIASIMDARGWDRAVAKPRSGASGHDVRLIERDALPRCDVEAYTPPGSAGQPAEPVVPASSARPFLVQEYLPEVAEDGEVSLVFFEGVFSHALLKCPEAGEFRVNSQYGGTTSLLDGPPAWLVDQARAVVDVLPEVPLYARVDGVRRDGCFVLLELELNEPALALHLAPGAADRFADAIVTRLATLRSAR